MTDDQLTAIQWLFHCFGVTAEDVVLAEAERDRPSKLCCILNGIGAGYGGPSGLEELAKQIAAGNGWLADLDMKQISFAYASLPTPMPEVFFVKHRRQVLPGLARYSIYSTTPFPKSDERTRRTMLEQCLIQIKLDIMDSAFSPPRRQDGRARSEGHTKTP